MEKNMKAWAELMTAMKNLDNSIPDYVFDDDNGEELADSISDVWGAIEGLQTHYGLNREDK